MKPVSPVVPGTQLPETIIAENQDEYGDLPAVHVAGGVILTRWQMSIWERLKVLFTGNVYLWMLTFGQPVQPVCIEVDKPAFENPELKLAVN